MKVFGFVYLYMGVACIVLSIIVSPIALIPAIVVLYLAWDILFPVFQRSKCKTVTYGCIKDIRTSGQYLNRQALYDAQISYLGRIKNFKHLPPNFIHEASAGDLVEILYNSKNPDIAFVNIEEE